MIMALDEDFEFLYEDKDDDDEDDNVDEDNICGLTVKKGHAIAFTNELFYAVNLCTICTCSPRSKSLSLNIE